MYDKSSDKRNYIKIAIDSSFMVNEGEYSLRLYCKLKNCSFNLAGCNKIASYVDNLPIFKFSLPCYLRHSIVAKVDVHSSC